MLEMTLLDLDAAGIDLDEPCPPDFMQFVYENSQDGYLTLWSSVLSEPGGPARIQKWFDDGLTEYHSRKVQIQMAPPTPNPPSGDNVTEVTYPEGSATPPVNRDVPSVYGGSAVGDTLTCTMGNWDNTPTSYAYAWTRGGIATGDSGETYALIASDAGYDIACKVTATNAAGSTEAPLSNAITVQVAAASPEGRTRREYPKEERK